MKITKEYLNEEFCVKKRLMRDIAKDCDCSIGWISTQIKKFGLKEPVEAKYIGKTFGELTPIKVLKYDNNSHIIVECQCSCGNIYHTRAYGLITGNTKSCGCKSRKRKTDIKYECPPKFITNDERMRQKYINKKFGKLTITDLGNQKGKEGRIAICVCDCGKSCEKTIHGMTHGRNRSCGCSKEYKGYEEISDRYWNRIKYNANIRKLEFNISVVDAWNLFLKQGRKCAISGVEIKFITGKDKNQTTASLDRIDSKKGYTLDNIQWVHKDVNFLKQDNSDENFIKWCHTISEYQKLCQK